ncbi:AMP-binding protein [Amycolatopsis acidicola]|uniref:AMP-binding protein n=1 Tax=Amycolatopsis acidicola TaxID=2596893 RepID=A0A5N0ULT3_9PSEU|nr:fatty acid--CoA ligase family protein [Amycolatopsis acidicola]KAA9150221.1 AMP-binding protein [Amycolatopsis acidicola]
MGIGMVLDMAADTHPDRLAFGGEADGMSYAQLRAAAAGGARQLQDARQLVFIGANGPALPVLLFSAAAAAVPFVPLNYRLSAEQLRQLIGRLDKPLVVADEAYVGVLAGCGAPVLTTDEFVARAKTGTGEAKDAPDDEVAIVLFTSGTTAAPKGVLLRHHNLVSYLLQTVEFAAADPDDAALVSTPPYHIAGMSQLLSNLYTGRRMVYLPDFTPEGWLETVRRENVGTAMVVPTMLARIVEHLDGAKAEVPSLRSLAYGGARMPLPVLEKALELFPDTGFVNAYGLTETSSTIAVLGPEDHREAIADPALRARLGSVGRPVPGVEAQIRDEAGTVLPEGRAGLLFVRGAQVSGEYLEQGTSLDDDGWFPTRDQARLEDGFLYLDGRADDTIIRGGENISPAEIEDVLLTHPAVREVAVVGLPDEEWGERTGAFVVVGAEVAAQELRDFVRARLRGSRTPDEVHFVTELPRTPTGKLVRRTLIADFS